MESSTISAEVAHNLIDSMLPIQNIADNGQFIGCMPTISEFYQCGRSILSLP